MVRVVAHMVALSMWTNSTCEETVPRWSSYTQALAGPLREEQSTQWPPSFNPFQAPNLEKMRA